MIGASLAHLSLVQPGFYNVLDYGLVGDGSTDNTTVLQTLINNVVSAGGGTFYFPAGIYLIAGALQDTSNSNCQLRIPAVALTASQVSITFMGPNPAPMQYDPNNGTIPPTLGYATIKSTLTGGSGTAAVLSTRTTTVTTFAQNQNNVVVNVKNLIFQCPPNPSLTCLNLIDSQANDMRGVMFHCGTVNLGAVVQPTNTNAYAIKLPAFSHSPCTRLDCVNIFGFYTGILSGELTEGNGVRMWGCYVGLEVPFSYYPACFFGLGVYWCPYGISFTGSPTNPDNGKTYFRCLFLTVEHANAAALQGQAWQQVSSGTTPPIDLLDTNNVGVGDITWYSVAANIGTDHVFNKSGGTGLITNEIGTIPGAAVVANNGWWNNTGAIAGAVAAYNATGAASYAASKTNLVNTQHTLTDGVAPTWANGSGWTFNGSTKYLQSDISPPVNQQSTLIIKYSGSLNTGTFLAGAINGGFLWGLQATDDSSGGGSIARVAYMNGSLIRVAPPLTAGVLALRGPQGYRGGTGDEGGAIAAAGSVSTPFFIGCCNDAQTAPTTMGFWSGVITSIAYYNVVLTAAQVTTIIASMP